METIRQLQSTLDSIKGIDKSLKGETTGHKINSLRSRKKDYLEKLEDLVLMAEAEKYVSEALSQSSLAVPQRSKAKPKVKKDEL